MRKNKQDKPEHRLILGIIVLFIGAIITALYIFTSGNKDFFVFLVGVGALCFGIYIMLTHSAYSRRYDTGNDRVFATPVAPDGSDLVPDVQNWQKQQAGDLTKDSPLEIKLKIIFAIAGIIGITVACIVESTLKHSFWVLYLIAFLPDYMRTVSPRAHWWADKLSVYAGIFFICLTPLIINILLENNAPLWVLILVPDIIFGWIGFRHLA